MDVFEVNDEQNKLTRQEFKRLLKLNLWCSTQEKLERNHLRMKSNKWILNFVFSIFGWSCAVLLVLMGLFPPYVYLQFVFMAIGLIGIIILLPRVSRLYRHWLNGWGFIAVKGIVTMVALVAVAWYPAVSQLKKDVIAERELQKINAMTPDQKYEYEEKQRRNAQLAEYERLKLEEKEERERIDRASKELANKEANDKKLSLLGQQDDIKQENKRQREFYDDLGSPKVLYKCKGSDFEKAVGAKFGNINMLLSDLQGECGAGYEILKRKD